MAMQEEGGLSPSPPPRVFSMRIVTLDYYMSCPHPVHDVCYSSFQGQPVAEVPIVRIFGTTLKGQKICLHLHKAFPYFYVPFDEELPREIDSAFTFVRQLAFAIEKALKLASTIGAKQQHLHSCSLVRAKKFYGFHLHEQLFVKIVLYPKHPYHPQEISRLSLLLLGGGILNRRFQPHESHVPYLLQVMIDHNLAGMGLLHLSDIKFRHPVLENQFAQVGSSMPKFQSFASILQNKVAHNGSSHIGLQLPYCEMELWCKTLDRGQESQMLMPEKQSTCELEADISVEAILNRRELLYTPLSRVGTDARMVQSLIPIWEGLVSNSGGADTGLEKTACPERCVQNVEYAHDFKLLLERIFISNEQSDGTKDQSLDQSIASFLQPITEGSQCAANGLPAECNALLMCTPAAHSKNDALYEEANEYGIRHSDLNKKLEGRAEMPCLDFSSRIADTDTLIDEEMIKDHLSQNSQDTDDEAVELLRWMISSQQENSSTVDENDLGKEEDFSWSQIFHSADEALAKAVHDYDQFSQQECQEIMECCEGIPDAVFGREHNSFKGTETQDGVAQIPQFDGSFDDSDEVTGEPSSNSGAKAEIGWGPISTRRRSLSAPVRPQSRCSSVPSCAESPEDGEVHCFDEQHAEDIEHGLQQETGSLRDLMRRKRKQKQQAPAVLLQDSLAVECVNIRESSNLTGFRRTKHAPVNIKGTPKMEASEISQASQEDWYAGNHIEVQVNQRCHAQTKLRAGENSSRFGPLPIVKRIVSVPMVGATSEAKKESAEKNLKQPSCSTVNDPDSIQSFATLHNMQSSTNDALEKVSDLEESGEHCYLYQNEKCCEGRSSEKKKGCKDQGKERQFSGPSGEATLQEGLPPDDHMMVEVLEPVPSSKLPISEDSAGTTQSPAQGTQDSDSVEEYAPKDTTCSQDLGIDKEEILQDKDASTRIGTECDLSMLTLHKKAPTTAALLARFDNGHIVDHGRAFYGRPEDIPDKPAVMAGLVFEVKSLDIRSLLPFRFANHGKERSLSRAYVSRDVWMPSAEDECATVLPSHFQNDGTVLYFLTPAQLPPTSDQVYHWLREQPKGKDYQSELMAEQSATGSVSAPNRQSSQCESDSQCFRLPSPKYDESNLMPFQFDGHEQNSAATFKEACYSMAGENEGPAMLHGSPHPRKNVDDFASMSQTHQLLPEPQHVSLAENKFHGHKTETNERTPRDGDFRSKNSKSVKRVHIPAGNKGDISQISGYMSGESSLTPISQAGFKDPASAGCGQQISVMSIEVFASTRGDLLPDPRYDAVNCIVAVLQDDKNYEACTCHTVILLNDKDEGNLRNPDAITGGEVLILKDETSLLQMFVWLVRIYDPDILVGWEIQGFSLGLLAERAANLGIGLLKEISRIPVNKVICPDIRHTSGETAHTFLMNAPVDLGVSDVLIIGDEWGRTHGSGIYVTGRIVLNLWRVMRSEIKLGLYTLEAVAEAALKRKVPSISWRTLTYWYSSGPGRKRHCCIEYFIERARVNLQLMDQLDLVNRTSELARVFGIDFFSVLTRGSQYRVESMMLRLAHSQNFLAISPSRQQVASQPAMQCLPLVMEPESRFYTDPVVVLDFQSLYPSMMIAYNLCFSTCLGKIVPDDPKVLGVTSLDVHAELLKDLKDSLTFTPNGIMFVSPKIRPGVLPRLLDEILSTRIMVKQSMKKLMTSEKILQRVLNARQLALKLISNVTYGYTAAGFSGRMPCAELADSIVQSGRHTLESAINFVNANAKWKARVVYGDTDSMFVLLEGRTRDEAFKIGDEIAAAVTAMNPHPVTLKMEKVYHPCVLLTKKRYVGYSYESLKQNKPTFDAKGIETVRRDSCGAVAKTLEQSLRILFETHDLSQVKSYIQRQWAKVLNGRFSVKDFVFAKEVRLGTYSARASVLPPAAIVATKAMSSDPRAEPRYGERIPYVVVHGEPGARLVDMVVHPHVLLDPKSSFRLHDTYYITKQIIPALQRVFGLIGVDVSSWYNGMPRPFRPSMTKRPLPTSPFSKIRKVQKYAEIQKPSNEVETLTKSNNKRTIDHYYLSQHCMVCGDLVNASTSVCGSCSVDERVVVASLLGRSSHLERGFKHLKEICRHCGGGDEWDIEEGIGCSSLACSVFFERVKVQKEYMAADMAMNQRGLTLT